MIRPRSTFAAVLTAGAMFLTACGDGDESSSTTIAQPIATEASDGTEAPADTEPREETETSPDTEAPEDTEAPAPESWAVDTADCVDPEEANAPIESTIKIASVMPLTGGLAAVAFAPVAQGYQAYIDYANENELIPGYSIDLAIEDDQYDPSLTPIAVATQIDAGAHLFSGITGSQNNIEVRQTLNDACIPQLNALTGSPEWGKPDEYPWTTGLLVPYTVESQVYAARIAELYPDGATVALFYVNDEFGQIYADAFKEIAGDYNLEIVDEQTIEATDSNAPTSQIASIAAEAPDAIMAVPLGAGCINFLTEVASAKAQIPGWAPVTFLTNTCASSLLLGAADAAADGLYTSDSLVDLVDPANDAIPAVAEYKAYMAEKGLTDVQTTAGAGWTAGEITVEMLRLAAESPEGLTRASIINAARNIDYVPSLAREGVVSRMNGEADPFIAESLIVIQYDADTETFTDVGELITQFES